MIPIYLTCQLIEFILVVMTSKSKKLLYIPVSPTGSHSTSRRIADEFLANWTAANPEGVLVTRDLSKVEIPHLDIEAIYAN